jgi:hypothetical protein
MLKKAKDYLKGTKFFVKVVALTWENNASSAWKHCLAPNWISATAAPMFPLALWYVFFMGLWRRRIRSRLSAMGSKIV